MFIHKKQKMTSAALRQMYAIDKLSSPKIAKIYRCRSEYIRQLLRKYKIPVRTKSEAMRIAVGIPISKTKLVEYYLKKRLSANEIAKKSKCCASLIRNKLKEYGIPARTVQQAKSLTKPRFKRKSFDGGSKTKAYLIGFRLGDLYVTQTHKNSPTIRIGTNSTKPAQIKLVEKLFKRYGHIWKSKPYLQKSKSSNNAKSAVHIRCFVNGSFSFLLKKKDEIEPWILNNNLYFLDFLAGYADAEGTFCLCGNEGVFSIKSQDKNIIWHIYEQLNKLQILCRPPLLARLAGSTDKRGVKNNRDVYHLTVWRKDALLKLINLIGPRLKHKTKLKEMRLIKKNVEVRNLKYNHQPDHRWYKSYGLTKPIVR